MTYGPCDLNQPVFRPRTHLYSLRPIGVGSPFVESLTSYITRLAEAHAVTPATLMTKEFLPRVLRMQGKGEHGKPPSPSYPSFVYDAYILNGLGRCTARWVTILEALTGQPNLHLLTVLTWRRVLARQGALLRNRRAWCPNCYADWRTSEQIVYEPLLWALKPVCVCTRHGVCLLEVCPHCRREAPILSARSRPGHCSRCRKWLGSDRHRPESNSDDRSYHLWAAESLGALLARAVSFAHPPQAQIFRENLRACINDLAEGNYSALSRTVGLHDSDFRSWIRHGLPEIDSLMRACFRLGIPPERFLAERLGTGDPDWENARDVIKHMGLLGPKRPTHSEVKLALRDALHSTYPPTLSELAVRVGFKRYAALYRRDRSTCLRITKVRARLRAQMKVQSRIPRLAVSKEQMTSRLKHALSEEPPPSVERVARELGFKYASGLYSRFPMLCQTLTVARRKYGKLRRLRVEATLKNALAEEPPPTLKQVANRLELTTPISLRDWFPDLCRLLVARRPKYCKERLARVRTTLLAALREEPPPLMKSVASRVGLSRSYLTMLFPSICRRLRARSAGHRKQEAETRRERLRQEAREIARKLLRAGTPPTRKRVMSMITRSPIKCGHLLIPEIRKVEVEVGAHGIKS